MSQVVTCRNRRWRRRHGGGVTRRKKKKKKNQSKKSSDYEDVYDWFARHFVYESNLRQEKKQ